MNLSGLKSLVDTLLSPREAFEALRERPTWGWAFLIGLVLTWIGVALAQPVVLHVMGPVLQEALSKNPNIAADKVPELVQQQIGIQRYAAYVVAPFGLLVGYAITAGIGWAFVRMLGGQYSFKLFWAMAANIGIVGAIGGLVSSVVLRLRPIDAFPTPVSLAGAMPSLGGFVDPSLRIVHAALSTLTPFGIWQYVLFALGLIAIGRLTRNAAVAAAGGLAITYMLLASLGGALAH